MLNRTSLMLAAVVVALSADAANAAPRAHDRHDSDSSASYQNRTGYHNRYNCSYDDGGC